MRIDGVTCHVDVTNQLATVEHKRNRLDISFYTAEGGYVSVGAYSPTKLHNWHEDEPLISHALSCIAKEIGIANQKQ
jgi:hypothetical protein